MLEVIYMHIIIIIKLLQLPSPYESLVLNNNYLNLIDPQFKCNAITIVSYNIYSIQIAYLHSSFMCCSWRSIHFKHNTNICIYLLIIIIHLQVKTIWGGGSWELLRYSKTETLTLISEYFHLCCWILKSNFLNLKIKKYHYKKNCIFYLSMIWVVSSHTEI